MKKITRILLIVLALAVLILSASSCTESVETADGLLQNYPDNLVELKLLLSAPLTASDSARLTANENLVSLITEVRTDSEIEFQSRKGLSDGALFDAYYKANYHAEPKSELKELFLSTLNELRENE